MNPSLRIAQVQRDPYLAQRIEAMVRAHWWSDDDQATNPTDRVDVENLAWAVAAYPDVQAIIATQQQADGGTNAIPLGVLQIPDDLLHTILLDPDTGALARLSTGG